jgi:endonuclease-3
VVYRTGFYRAKAKNVQACAREIVERFGGEVPRTMAELTSLPGVARKTANVVQGNLWGASEGICVDTHVGRVARRLGLTRAVDPAGVEDDLVRLYPEEQWVEVPYHFIQLGRSFCDARVPRCDACHLADLCPRRGVA